MLSTRHQRLWATVALCLAALLAACAPTTATPEGLPGTPAPGSTQPAPTAVEAEPSLLPASPTAPASPTGAPTSPASATAAPAASPGPTRLTPVLPVAPLPVPTSALGPVTGEVPQALLEAIYQDAQNRTGVARAQISLLRAEAVTWRDGSLGCPQPGMMYTEALVPGYWVVLEANGQELDYHASQSGYFFLCESPLPRQEPLPGGGSS